MLKDFVSTKGSIDRLEWWKAQFCVAVLLAICAFCVKLNMWNSFPPLTRYIIGGIAALCALFAIWLVFVSCLKRLRNLGRSWAWLLLLLPWFAAITAPFFFLFLGLTPASSLEKGSGSVARQCVNAKEITQESKTARLSGFEIFCAIILHLASIFYAFVLFGSAALFYKSHSDPSALDGFMPAFFLTPIGFPAACASLYYDIKLLKTAPVFFILPLICNGLIIATVVCTIFVGLTLVVRTAHQPDLHSIVYPSSNPINH